MLAFFDANQTAADTLLTWIQRKLPLPGSPKFAYMVLNKKNPTDTLIISSYPEEWVTFYRTSNLQLTDPVVLDAFKRTSPFVWDENITLMSDLKFTKIFALAREYNIVNGYSFVLHDHLNNLAILSVLIDDSGSGKQLEPHLVSERNAIQMLLIDIHEQMYRLAEAAPANHSRRKTAKALFTARENEVLYWASMGKTYGEIALIAGISLSTVKFHIRNAVSKLGVSNARQAIRLGVELALIKPAASAARS